MNDASACLFGSAQVQRGQLGDSVAHTVVHGAARRLSAMQVCHRVIARYFCPLLLECLVTSQPYQSLKNFYNLLISCDMWTYTKNFL